MLTKLALYVAVAMLVVFLLGALSKRAPPTKSEFGGPDLSRGYPYGFALDTTSPAEVAENRMFSTAEVDPIVTGQLYANARASGADRRWVYGGRVAHGGIWGLREFSTGVPGEAGVDVGPLGMREYSLDGKQDVFDDGIPENWQLPSTPTSWYVPAQSDYYDVEASAPAAYKPHLVSLQEPDHEPLLN